MKVSRLLPFLGAISVLSTAASCASVTDKPANTGVDSNGSIAENPASPTNQPNPTANTTDNTTTEQQIPSTKTDTISVEGEKSEITLKLYNDASPVFTTYYPQDDFVVESGGSGEGTGARFYFNAGGTKSEDVYVAMFFPANITTLEQIKQLVTQKNGLLESNQWKVVNQTEEAPYSWAKERIVFQQDTGSQPIQGEVYIGESNGKAFYVITHYPAEYAEGFGPRANLILKNLEVRD